MGGECNTHGRDEKTIKHFRANLEDLEGNGRMLLEWILEI